MRKPSLFAVACLALFIIGGSVPTVGTSAYVNYLCQRVECPDLENLNLTLPIPILGLPQPITVPATSLDIPGCQYSPGNSEAEYTLQAAKLLPYLPAIIVTFKQMPKGQYVAAPALVSANATPGSMLGAKTTYGGSPIVSVDESLGFVTVLPAGPEAAMKVKQDAAADANVLDCDVSTLVSADFSPNDPLYCACPPPATGWQPQWNLPRMHVDDAWASASPIFFGSPSITVCVVDSGVKTSHIDLAGAYVAGKNFVPQANGGPVNPDDIRDYNGHGTAMASIILAGTNESVGMAGIAQSGLLVARVMDGTGNGMAEWIASGIAWCADQGANVISLSLGGPSDASRIMQRAVQYAWGKGSLLVAAVGNGGGAPVSYPAAHVQAIAVACVDDGIPALRCTESNVGTTTFISAPADTNITVALADNSTLSLSAGGSCLPGSYDCYIQMPRAMTSGATAMVAGVAALIWAKTPALTNQDIRDILQCTADVGAVTGTQDQVGHGMVDADDAMAAASGSGSCAPPYFFVGPPGSGPIWSEDFDGTFPGSWYAGTTSGPQLWHAETGSCTTPEGGTGYGAWTRTTYCDYNTGGTVRNWITSPLIDLSSYGNAFLQFYQQFWIESYPSGSYDQLYLWVYDGSWHLEKGWDSTSASMGSCPSGSVCMTPWDYNYINLNNYVGKQIYLAFDARTIDSLYNDFKGWYLDSMDVRAWGTPPPAPIPSWTEDFECLPPTCASQWQFTGTPGPNGLWHVTSHRASGGSNSLWYGQESTGNYETGSTNSGVATASIISPCIHVPSTGGPLLKFKSWAQREYSTYWDELRIEVGQLGPGCMGPSAITCLASVYTGGGASNPCTGKPPIPYYPMNWDELTYSLGDYAGDDIQLRFIFDTRDNLYNDYEGWYIDDLQIVN